MSRGKYCVLEHGGKIETILLRTCFFLPGLLGSILIIQATAFPRDCLDMYEYSEGEVILAGVVDVASVTASLFLILSLSFRASHLFLLDLSIFIFLC